MNFDEQYFHLVYRNYSARNPPRKLRFYRHLLQQHLGNSACPRILDLGCAFGSFLKTLGGNCRKFGMDVSRYALARAAKRVPDARFVLGDCTKPPFALRFDAIVAFDVLEHVPDLDSTSEFVRNSLTADGVFVFVVPVYDGPLGPVVRWLDTDPTHIQKQSRNWWLDWARENFEVIAWTGIFRYLVPTGCYIHISGAPIRRLAPAIAVVARPRQDFRGPDSVAAAGGRPRG